jgi:hypothetical protein
MQYSFFFFAWTDRKSRWKRLLTCQGCSHTPLVAPKVQCFMPMFVLPPSHESCLRFNQILDEFDRIEGVYPFYVFLTRQNKSVFITNKERSFWFYKGGDGITLLKNFAPAKLHTFASSLILKMTMAVADEWCWNTLALPSVQISQEISMAITRPFIFL